MNHGRSFTLASVVLLVLYVASYAWHAVAAGTFALPPPLLAIMAPLTPVVDYLLAYAIHGLVTGEWEPPLPLRPAGKQPTPPT